ncbi:helix-turn-helix domain-containing protein [Streptomyces bobili]|uniref:helix-turn-helix domain-containing protein n=1 Tax=Streptomyces bobili TaxID=67280 RepID=UPI000A3B5371|nr:helix-turn-helix domain-containing protein [Streptomyces bobili]
MTSLPSERSPHLTVKQLAKRWQTTPTAIYIARHRGKAPTGFKRGALVLFPISEVERFEAAQMAGDRPSHRGATPEHRPAEPLRARRGRSTAAA